VSAASATMRAERRANEQAEWSTERRGAEQAEWSSADREAPYAVGRGAREESSATVSAADREAPYAVARGAREEASATMKTVPEMLAEHAVGLAGRAAVLAGAQAPLTFSALWRQVESTGAALRRLGVGREDVVALVAPRGPASAVALVAVLSNAVVAPLDPSLTVDELTAALSRLAARLLVVPPDCAPHIRSAAHSRGIPVQEFATLAAAGLAHPVLAGLEPDSAAMLVETSGTTGRPKLIRITHGRLAASAVNLGRFLGFGPADRSFNVMPLFNIGGSISSLLLPLYSGSSVVCVRSLDEGDIASDIVRHRPTWYTAAPALHELVLAAVRRAAAPIPFRFVRSTSAPLGHGLRAELEAVYGVPVLDAYGLSEAAGQVSSNPLPPGRRKPGTVGPPVGCEVLISTDNGPAGRAEIGEVLIRGQQVISGYGGGSGDPGDVVDGWLRTGDLGFLDADGYLVLTGRVKEVINRGGEKIAPAEVEAVLLSHPAVREAAVFPVAHPTLGEDGAAAVVLADGTDAVDPAELRRFAASRLSAAKVPRRVLIVGELPRTALGKVPRRRMSAALGLDRAEAVT